MRASRKVVDRAAARRDEAWRAAAAANRRRCRVLLGTPVVPGLVLMALGALSLALFFAGVVVTVAWALIAARSWRAAGGGAGKRLGAMSTDEAVAAGALSPVAAGRFSDVAESLCAALGLEVPRLQVLVDTSPNAVTTGTRRPEVRLTLTTGLLAALDRIELEAVLAHELSHSKRLDTLSGGLSTALLGGGRLPLPGCRRLAAWLEGPARELEADLAAVQVTRYPPALVAALEQAGEAPSVEPDASVTQAVRSATARQWLVPFVPLDDGAFALADRLEVLVEL
jgi:Zn-dependent protease with chaperone function